MSRVHKLTSLTRREAIADAMYRALIGFDRNDHAVFDSAFASEDVTFEVRSQNLTINGLSNVRKQMLEHVGPMDTTHMVSNVRVEVEDGASTAFLTAYAMAQHCPPGRGKEPDGPKYMVGAEYLIDLELDETDGMWKIKKWVLDVIWRQGDRAVMQRPE